MTSLKVIWLKEHLEVTSLSCECVVITDVFDTVIESQYKMEFSSMYLI